jgi:pimeloyl-ACP methyl ester carboxylesterase
MTRGRLLTFGKVLVEYRIAGDSSERDFELVMLHEGLGSAAMWKDFPDRLADATGCRVIVYSRRGYGASSSLGEERTPNYMHEEARYWLPLVLDRLDVRRPVLFGHSDGASIALIHAAEPAARVAGVVGLAPHVKVEPLTIASIAQAKIAYETTNLRGRLASYHSDVDSVFWSWNRIWLSPAFRRWNIEALLPAIRAPVLAIQGRDDEYGTLEQIESIRRALPETELLVLNQCRHSPHRDQPSAVLQATRHFIDRIGQR